MKDRTGYDDIILRQLTGDMLHYLIVFLKKYVKKKGRA